MTSETQKADTTNHWFTFDSIKKKNLFWKSLNRYPVQTKCNCEKMSDFCQPRRATVHSAGSPAKHKSPNWIHVLCITTLFKYDHPRTDVSQNAYGNRAPAFVMPTEDTGVFVSVLGENCAARLFVGFFTSLLMSAQIKWPFTPSALEHGGPESYSLSRETKRQCDLQLCSKRLLWVCLHAHVCVCVCTYTCMYAFFHAQCLKWFSEWERTTLRSKLTLLLSNQDFPLSEITEWEFGSPTASGICQPAFPHFRKCVLTKWSCASSFCTMFQKNTFTENKPEKACLFFWRLFMSFRASKPFYAFLGQSNKPNQKRIR